MAQSREQLTMDMMKSDNSIFKRQRGCWLSRPKAAGLFALFILAAVAVGFLTHHITKCDSDSITALAPDSAESSDSFKSAKVKDVRLPTNIIPLYYKLDLIPYVEEAKNFTIDGKVWIDILCTEATRKITIHSKNITIDEASVKVFEISEPEMAIKPNEEEEGTKGNFRVVKHEYDHPREFYNASLNSELQQGKHYRVFIRFTALLADSLGGFYRSSYTDKTSNETRFLGTTQFQATDARRAFPCFDEPALKAKFEVSLARRVNMSSISNMDLITTESVEGMDGWMWDHYNKSVPMSTYLVAFVVSDFESRTSDRTLSTPEFRVWARKDAIDQTEYARDIGPRILTYYEEYFNVSFPLPKQDMIALPDFGAGAMENWGLITYRETALLYDPKVSSDSSKMRIATVVAHELAHMWYGNLVTMAWWSDLWLNEGFASYVEYIGTNHVEPEWKVLEQFIPDELQYVFSLDALDSSHPIFIPVGHPDEISEIFDSISYSKGASIIRMMNHYLTEDVFRTGLTNYLTKWKFNNTVQDDLWESLTEQAHIKRTLDPAVTVKEVMDTWTLQKGFPVIQVDRNYVGREATLTQTKFQLIKDAEMAKTYEGYSWWVPISYASKTFNTDFQRTQPVLWMRKAEKNVTTGVQVDKEDWLILNVQETGFYRVNYDLKNWQLIINQLQTNASAIHTVNRAQLMDDVLNLARASLMPYDLAFNVTMYLTEEEEYLPWESFLNGFSFISNMLKKSSIYGVFKQYVRELLKKEYSRVKFEEKSTDLLLEKLHRINILTWACAADYEECIDSTKELFANWMESPEPDKENNIATNLRRLVYCSAIKKGGEKEWDFLWNRYLASNVASEKTTILSSLACSRETWLLNRYLNWSITAGSNIRKQDARVVIQSIASNDVGNYLAFNFIRDKWPVIKAYMGDGGLFSFGGMVKSIASLLNTPFELTEMQRFKDKYKDDLGSASRAIDQAIETVKAQITWTNENFAVISSWLDKAVRENTESMSTSTSPQEL